MGLRSQPRLRAHQRELPDVIASQRGAHLLGNYNRLPVTFVRGEECELIADDGARYLDCIAGIGVCALGHAHPAVTQAVATQAATLVHSSNLYHHEPAAELAAELCKRSGFGFAFFCNSGTEANEAAIKLARKRAFRAGEPQRIEIVSCTGSFHGRTFGALAATANAAYQEGFGPMPAGFTHVAFNDAAALEGAVGERTAAVLIEPVQGESGVHPADRTFLETARRVCDERGALLIFDEVQCGMGRLGPLFAFEHFGVRPDAVTLAKALANGLPIGALLIDAALGGALQPGDHGSTFGGSPVPCAAGLAHLRFRDESGLAAQVAQSGAYFANALDALTGTFPDVLCDPRGIGLMRAVTVREPYEAAQIVRASFERGVLINAAGGNSLRFLPPLVVREHQIDRVVQTLREVVEALQRG